MPPKKGVSAAEKRDKMLEIFHESSDVFVIKDIEKLAVKKGIISQAVKDVLQSLVDDDLVRLEKIGASNYYWSFPAEASVKLAGELAKNTAELSAARKRKATADAAIAQYKAARPDTERLAQQLGVLRELQVKLAAAQGELAMYKDNDPETVEAMRNAAKVAKEAANRWLDNTYSLLSWCKKKFSGHEAELTALFEQNGLTDSIDYLE